MKITDAAARVGLPAKTLRYYEDIGLVTPARRANGYRNYDGTQLHKLAFVARARSLGFSIEDCRALLTLYEDGARSSADVKRLTHEHITAIDRKITELQSMRRTLCALAEACHGDARPDCPILDDLAGGGPQRA
jgi:MerR family copper efflux transcriptional regulator